MDDLDKELDNRGHKYCRYADDLNLHVRLRRVAERVLNSLTGYLSRRLKLKVNQAKNAVPRPWERKFLGYSMTSQQRPRLKVAPAGVQRLKLKRTLRSGRGHSFRGVG